MRVLPVSVVECCRVLMNVDDVDDVYDDVDGRR